MKTNRYKHSKVFAQYKAIHEDIQDNLTSLEYLQILDFLLKKAWAPVVALCPVYMRNFVAKVFAYQNVRSAIKVSSENKDNLNVDIFNFLCSSDVKSSIKSFEKIHLNRGIIIGALTRFLQLGEKYNELWSPFNTQDIQQKTISSLNIETQLGLTGSRCNKFFTVYKHVRYWMQLALEFRSKILQKYVRMALLQAKKTYEDYHHVIDLDDISSIYIATVGKAIDRCDSRLGVLTTFIQNWLQSARSEVQDIIASITPCSSYEELLEESPEGSMFPAISPNTSYENIQYIAHQAKKVDPDGVLRIMLGIPENLSLAERNILLKYI